MALAKATPVSLDGESTQQDLTDTAAAGGSIADITTDGPRHRATDA
jgi:hypothetical protein